MYTAADVNLTSTDIYPDHYSRSYYKDNETRNQTYYRVSINDDLKKVTITLYVIIFVLGTVSNGLVIWIAGFRMKKTISAVWFLNLAIADFLCCASLPLRITEWFFLSSKSTEYSICISNLILFNLNGSASVLLLVAMSIDRCVSVMWPFWAKVHRTRKLVRITAAIVWVMSFLMTGLVHSLYGISFMVNEWCAFDYWYRKIALFYLDNYISKLKHTIQLPRLVIMFVIPFLIILISYVIIFIKLRKSKRPQRSQRPYRIITAVILGFFICWLPFHICPLILTYDEPGDHIQFYTVNTIAIILASLNSCLNPIIYVFMGRDVKLGFFRSIPARLEKALSEHPNDLCREREDCVDTRTTSA